MIFIFITLTTFECDDLKFSQIYYYPKQRVLNCMQFSIACFVGGCVASELRMRT